MMQWVAYAQCTLAKKTRSKRDQNEIKTRSPIVRWRLRAHMRRTRARKFTHFCTCCYQLTSAPTFRLNSAPANASRPSAPAQPCTHKQCTHASQMVRTPARSARHARSVQMRGKARCRLKPAAAKETSCLKIAKHTNNMWTLLGG